VNYETLLELIKYDFQQPRDLLEEVIQSIAFKVKEKFPQTEYLFISMKKNNPPLSAEVESSEVVFETKY
jgi:dihydroneopterin aldolase